MRGLNSPTQGQAHGTPLLYRQPQDQLSQWVQPKDRRHRQGFAEIVAAILQSGEACLGRWIPYLSHRDCQARAHMGRLSYFLHNEQITAARYYEPLPLPILPALPKCNPPPACASQSKRDALDCRIEFAKVISFSF